MSPCTVAHQALLSMEFSSQEYWSGLPFPPPENLSRLKDQNLISRVSCIGRWISLPLSHLGSLRGWSLGAGKGKARNPFPEPPEREAARHSLILALLLGCCLAAELCLFVISWTAARQASLSFTISPEFAQVHVH